MLLIPFQIEKIIIESVFYYFFNIALPHECKIASLHELKFLSKFFCFLHQVYYFCVTVILLDIQRLKTQNLMLFICF